MWRPLLNLTVLSFFSHFPGAACGSPPVPSGNYSVARLDPNLCSNVSATRSTPTFPVAPAARGRLQPDPTAHPPRRAWEDRPHPAAGCPSVAQTRRFPGFKGRFHSGTERSRPRSEWSGGAFVRVCVSRQGCGTDIHGTGPGGPRRQGIWASSGSSRTVRGLGNEIDRKRATGRRRRSASAPGNRNYSRSQDHEQRSLDWPGCVRDFSEVRQDRGKRFNGMLTRCRVCFRHRLLKFKNHRKYRTRYVRCGCCSVAKSCPTLWDPTDCSSTPGFPVLHYLPEFAQIHVRCVDDAIQPSHLPSPRSPPVLNLSQHQGLFQ